jgi:hypothetical protein
MKTKSSFTRYAKQALLALLFLLAVGQVAFADILGDTVEIQFLFPDMNTQFGLSTMGVVTNSGVSLNLFDNQLVTVFADHVDMVALRDSFFQSAEFNGVSVQDLTNPNAFTSASVDAATTVVGFDDSRVSIVGGLLYINYQGLDTPQDSLARVDFSGQTTTPEPTSLLLLGSGILGAAGTLRKKFMA